MIDVSRVIIDPRLSQKFKLFRTEGKFVKGKWLVEDEIEVELRGVIKPASSEDIEMIPEGDRTGGEIVVYALKELRTTTKKNTGDEILWNKERYKIHTIGPYKDYGFYKAIAIKKERA